MIHMATLTRAWDYTETTSVGWVSMAFVKFVCPKDWWPSHHHAILLYCPISCIDVPGFALPHWLLRWYRRWPNKVAPVLEISDPSHTRQPDYNDPLPPYRGLKKHPQITGRTSGSHNYSGLLVTYDLHVHKLIILPRKGRLPISLPLYVMPRVSADTFEINARYHFRLHITTWIHHQRSFFWKAAWVSHSATGVGPPFGHSFPPPLMEKEDS